MSQNSLVDATSGTLSGLTLVENLNNALDTLNTLASGASAPSSPEAGQLWHDTGNNLLKLRSEDNTSWIAIGGLDETHYLFTAQLAAVAATLSGINPIANGGTGAASQAAALANILGSTVIGAGNGGTGVPSLANLFSSSFAVNGYRRNLIDSFMFQWETTGTIGAGSGASVYFPASFPNACMAAVACRNIAGATSGGANVYGWTNNAVSVYNGSSTASPITIIAIGY